jgi:hypothetical protein
MEREVQIKLTRGGIHGALLLVGVLACGIEARAQGIDASRCTTRYEKGKAYTYCFPHEETRKDSSVDGRVLENAIGSRTGKAAGSAAKPTPKKGGGGAAVSRVGSAAPLPVLHAVRSLISPTDTPPRDVAGYGIVAFTTKPIQQDVERYRFVCEAFKATLMTTEELPSNVPTSDQMVTFWPVNDKTAPEATKGDCAYLVDHYALGPALAAIQDADKLKEGLSARRGPFLIAWAPSESRYKPDAVVLVMELSSLESQRSFLEVFQDWRRKIVDNPELWRRGFDVESVRRTVRDTFDHYGGLLVRLIKPTS